MTTPTKVRFPGGESYADLHARSLAAVATLRTGTTTETVVAVAHGGVVRAVLERGAGDAGGADLPARRRARVAHDGRVARRRAGRALRQLEIRPTRSHLSRRENGR